MDHQALQYFILNNVIVEKMMSIAFSDVATLTIYGILGWSTLRMSGDITAYNFRHQTSMFPAKLMSSWG